MASRFKKPIAREIDLPVTEELRSNGSCKVAPHIVTFDDVGVAIRRKNSKTVLFAEWRQIYLNRLNSGIFHTQESAEEERELRRSETVPRKKKGTAAPKTKPALRGSPVSDDSEVARPELPPEIEEQEPVEVVEKKTLFEEMDEF